MLLSALFLATLELIQRAGRYIGPCEIMRATRRLQPAGLWWRWSPERWEESKLSVDERQAAERERLPLH